jgi:hypothetical protein
MARIKGGKATHLTLDSSVSLTPWRTSAALPVGTSFHLAPDDIDELRFAIERSLCEGEIGDSTELVVDEELRKSLRVACAKARLQRVRAEHVLVDVKQIWTSIPGMLATRTCERLSEIVTACIDEYYMCGDHELT